MNERVKRLRNQALAVFGVLLLGAIALRASEHLVPPPEGTRRGEIVTDASAAACPDRITRGAFFCEVNAIRKANGLQPVRSDRRLTRAASGWSRFQVAAHTFAHEVPGRPGLTQRIRRTGYLRRSRQWVVGEVIAFGSGTAAQPAAIVGAWMRSPQHRDQLVNRAYRHAGLGIVRRTPEGGAGYTFTLDLGRRY
jgi:hypothetical protein